MAGFMRTLVFAALSAAMLVACGDSPSDEQAAATRSNQAARPKGDDLGTNMVAAVPAGRSSTAIRVHFALGMAPEIDKPLPVEIAIVPGQDFAAVRARFEGTEGLALSSGEELPAANSPRINSIIKHQLVLLPKAEGVFMITATVDTDSAIEGGVTRVFSLPVVVAGKPSANAAAGPGAKSPASPTPAPDPPSG
jgi:hypothetical protein